MTEKGIHIDQNPLLAYGKPVADYRGNGILVSTDKKTYECKFVAGQMADGNILLLCDIMLQKGQSLSSNNLGDITFGGETEDGWKITLKPVKNIYSALK